MTASPTLIELLEESLGIPDDVYAIDADQPDPFGWSDDSEAPALPPLPSTPPAGAPPDPDPAAEPELERARRLRVMPSPAKRSLRDRVGAVEYIADLIEQLDDEAMTAEVRDELSRQLIDELAGTRAKVDATSATLAMFESLEASAAAERDRLAKRVARYAAQRERLETYVLAVLTASKLDKIDGETSTLARRLNPVSVRIDCDPATLPREFLRFAAPPPPPPPAPDKTELKRALQAGREIDGVRLERRAKLVRS